jgi:hypothetical protein
MPKALCPRLSVPPWVLPLETTSFLKKTEQKTLTFLSKATPDMQTIKSHVNTQYLGSHVGCLESKTAHH